jgi:hypothetical protein
LSPRGTGCLSDIEEELTAVLKSQGSPASKRIELILTSTYPIPYFTHKTILAIPPITTIRMKDADIRNAITATLHLPTSFSSLT